MQGTGPQHVGDMPPPTVFARQPGTGGADGHIQHGHASPVGTLEAQTCKFVAQRHRRRRPMQIRRFRDTFDGPVPADFGVRIFVLSWAQAPPNLRGAGSHWRPNNYRVEEYAKAVARQMSPPNWRADLRVGILGLSPEPRPPTRYR